MPDLQEQFGQIDIYLFDQLLGNRIGPGMRVLDAGCGSGRNLCSSAGWRLRLEWKIKWRFRKLNIPTIVAL